MRIRRRVLIAALQQALQTWEANRPLTLLPGQVTPEMAEARKALEALRKGELLDLTDG